MTMWMMPFWPELPSLSSKTVDLPEAVDTLLHLRRMELHRIPPHLLRTVLQPETQTTELFLDDPRSLSELLNSTWKLDQLEGILTMGDIPREDTTKYFTKVFH